MMTTPGRRSAAAAAARGESRVARELSSKPQTAAVHRHACVVMAASNGVESRRINTARKLVGGNAEAERQSMR